MQHCLQYLQKEEYDRARKALADAGPGPEADALRILCERLAGQARMEEGMRYLALGKYDKASAVVSELKDLAEGQVLGELTAKINELAEYAAKLSNGNLSATFPSKKNYIAMSVKNLHSKLNHLVWQISQVAQGDYSQTADYMGELSEGFNWMTAQLSMREAQTTYERSHDVETGLLNRSTFSQRVHEAILAQPDQMGALLCGGLDNIKYINETYGHENGDRNLIAAADMFRHFEEEGAIVARISGDEFAVYHHGHATAEEAAAFMEDFLRNRFSSATIQLGEEVKIRASYGMALYPEDAATVDNLIKFASHTMFEVKKINRGALMRFNAEIYRTKANVFDRQEKLNRLIDERMIRFAFQPIVRFGDAAVVGYEALMRPLTEDFSGPLDILTLAEAQSKLYQIEKLTFEAIFDWVYRHMPQLGDIKVFFNTVSTQFLRGRRLLEIHPQYRDICSHMVFEVLENAGESEQFAQAIEAFRQEVDVLIAIDDYGCGYSNDLRLISLGPDIVKIDRFFIKDIDQNVDKQLLLAKIITYCRSRGIEALAEGIETLAELETAVRLGFSYGQGFYLGRPDFRLRGLSDELRRQLLALSVPVPEG